jgi:uncharacterized protein YbjT (DUF2867 family)
VLRTPAILAGATHAFAVEEALPVAPGGKVFTLSPIKEKDYAKAFAAALDRVNKKYPKALQKLAE